MANLTVTMPTSENPNPQMTTHPHRATTTAARIEAYSKILDGLYDALDRKAGRGSVVAGEVNVTFSSYEQLQKLIDTYTARLNRLKAPGRKVITCR